MRVRNRISSCKLYVPYSHVCMLLFGISYISIFLLIFMPSLSALEAQIHNCTLCKQSELAKVVKYYPIISFGELENKPLLVVGLNPSTREYEDGYVINVKDPVKRHISQMTYFDLGYYDFFRKLERFFQGEARTALDWKRFPWEKVGFTDLAKCPTRNEKGQWTQLRTSQKRGIIENCQGFLYDQIQTHLPTAIFAYGTDVCRWFYPAYIRDKDAFTTIKWLDLFPVILVPQTQTGYPRRVIKIVQDNISEVFE